jgi:hypothetical protein
LPRAIAAAILVASASFATAAYATETQYRYTTPKTGYFSISAGAMAPTTISAFNDYFVSNGTLFVNTGSEQCFNAGVNVPTGAKITGLAMFYRSANSHFRVRLQRYRFTDGALTDIINRTITDSSSTRTPLALTASAADAATKVSNVQYNYVFNLCLNHPSQEFYGARIIYTYTNAGD